MPAHVLRTKVVIVQYWCGMRTVVFLRAKSQFFCSRCQDKDGIR